jgi:hypothetical protein
MYIPVPGEVTPQWLTAVLHQADVIGPGEVTAVKVQATGAFNSHTSHIALAYSSDILPDAPTRLVLKRNIEEAWGIESGEDEVKFYKLITSLPIYPPAIVHCYVADYDEQSGNSYLLYLLASYACSGLLWWIE